MSRAGVQMMMKTSFFGGASDSIFGPILGARGPTDIQTMTRRAYLARMCMLHRVIRGLGGASFKFNEK